MGGRVAGAATAILLAEHGHRVALVDRDRHPSPTLSTHVFGDWEAFARLRVLESILDAGAPRVSRFRSDVHGCVTEADLIVTPFVLGLRRERLDPILLERARSFPNLRWLEGVSVDAVLAHRGSAAGVLAGGQELRARVVVGADGRSSFVARQVRATSYLVRPAQRCAYYAYFAGVAPAPIPALEYYWAGDDIVLLIPCDGGLCCVCVMPPQAEFPAWRRDRERLLLERLEAIPTLAPRLKRAVRVGQTRGTGTLKSYLRQSYGPGWALVGDAGAAVHPCVGAGIDHAAASGALLADALHEWLAGRSRWDDALARYQAARDRLVRPTLEAAVALARRTALSGDRLLWLRLLLTLPGLAHELGLRATDVVEALAGPDATAALAPLVQEPAPAPLDAFPERPRAVVA